MLLMQRDAELPLRCIYCNEAADPGKLHRLSYLNIWLQLAMLVAFVLLRLLALIPILILILVFRKTVKIKIPLCNQHRKRRFWLGIIAVGLLLLAILVAFLVIRSGDYAGPALIVSFALLAAAMLFAVLRGQLLRINKMTPDLIKLRGAKAKYLDSLPEHSG